MPNLIEAGSKAIKTLQILGYTYHNGELWKPPLGKRPEWLDYPPTIAQSIRNAAVDWPQFLGDVECGILDAFCISSVEDFYFKDNLRFGTLKEKNQSRTFMLLVAEALE